MRKRNAGVTLLEAVIGSAIMVLIAMMAWGLLFSSTKTAAEGSLASDLEFRGRRFVDFCRVDFLQAKFTGSISVGGGAPLSLGIDPNLGNTSIGYQLPGENDSSGKDLGKGIVVYGYPSPIAAANGFRQTLVCFLRFEADTVIKESAASPDPQPLPDWGAPFPNYPVWGAPVIMNQDINKDGDQTDTFVRGKIKKYLLAPQDATNPVYVANGGKCLLSTETLSDNVVLRVTPGSLNQFNFNVQSDVAAPPSILSPLFQFVDQNGPNGTPITNLNVATQGYGIMVKVWHGTFDNDGKGFMIRNNTATVRFRNAQ